MNYWEWNRLAWNRRAQEKLPYVDTAGPEDFLNPREAIDAFGWLPQDLTGLRTLCLGAAGGRHGPLLATLGAQVTVVDLSDEMLELDRKMARERNLELQLVQSSMDDLSALPPHSFDLVVQPVSSCYLENVETIYQQVVTVIKPGALYISHHKQPVALQLSWDLEQRRYYLGEPYYRTGPLPPAEAGSLHRESGTVEFVHRWGQLLGGLCRRGFILEDFAEPRHGSPESTPGTFSHRSFFAAPFFSVKARKRGESSSGSFLVRPGD